MALDGATQQWLKQTWGHRVSFQEPMARHTYFRVGGPADALVTPETQEELRTLVDGLWKKGVPYMVIGGGTNLVVRDGGIRGVVLSIGKCLRKIDHEQKSAGEVLLTCGAGLKLPSLCRYAVDHGLKGMNFAIGIPGTVGGGVAMNAGTRYGCIADVLDAVTILDAAAKRQKIKRKDLDFSYRTLNWGAAAADARDKPAIILEADFRLRVSAKEALREEADRIAAEKRLSQPTREPSAGCFFKNPVSGKTAGQLIEMAGLKGRRLGDAEVSDLHANFIVNKGAATAKDILELKESG